MFVTIENRFLTTFTVKVTFGGQGGHSPAGAGRALWDAQKESGGADLLELGLLAGVQKDHGEREIEGDPQTIHHLLAQFLTEGQNNNNITLGSQRVDDAQCALETSSG